MPWIRALCLAFMFHILHEIQDGALNANDVTPNDPSPSPLETWDLMVSSSDPFLIGCLNPKKVGNPSYYSNRLNASYI